MVVAPASEITEKVASSVRPEISVVAKTGSKIGSIEKKKNTVGNSDSVVYKISCGTGAFLQVCKKMYFGESGRGLPTRLKEHKADLRHHRVSNALVIHAERTDHLPNWAGATAMHTGLTKIQRRAVEEAYITVEENINTSSGFFRLANPVAQRIMKSFSNG